MSVGDCSNDHSEYKTKKFNATSNKRRIGEKKEEKKYKDREREGERRNGQAKKLPITIERMKLFLFDHNHQQTTSAMRNIHQSQRERKKIY